MGDTDDETITRVCDCGACGRRFSEPMDEDARNSEHATGLYCSDECARHAGGPLWVAQVDHEEGL